MFEKEVERLKFLILEVVCNRCDSLNCNCDICQEQGDCKYVKDLIDEFIEGNIKGK